MHKSELIAELGKWPESEVTVVLPTGFVVPIYAVSGAAGAAIDGHDSVITLHICAPRSSLDRDDPTSCETCGHGPDSHVQELAPCTVVGCDCQDYE